MSIKAAERAKSKSWVGPRRGKIKKIWGILQYREKARLGKDGILWTADPPCCHAAQRDCLPYTLVARLLKPRSHIHEPAIHLVCHHQVGAREAKC
jgi:hypothetical protein